MVLRLLIVFLLVYIFFLLIYSILSGGKSRNRGAGRSPGTDEEMVLDPQCQSYIPKGEALQRQGRYFCSEECARAFHSQ